MQTVRILLYGIPCIYSHKLFSTGHRSLGQRFGVQGFPTLKYFDGKSPEPSPYESKRDLESLQNYITEKTGIKPKIKKEPSNHVVVLSDANFSEIVNGNKNVLVEFYAVCIHRFSSSACLAVICSLGVDTARNLRPSTTRLLGFSQKKAMLWLRSSMLMRLPGKVLRKIML